MPRRSRPARPTPCRGQSPAVRLEAGRADDDGLLVATLGGQSLHHPRKDPHVTPLLPAVAEGLGRAILPRRIKLTQAIAIEEYYAAQNAPIIRTRLAMALREERRQPLHLLFGQPEKVAHLHPRQFGSLNLAGRAASSRLMDPNPVRSSRPAMRSSTYPPLHPSRRLPRPFGPCPGMPRWMR